MPFNTEALEELINREGSERKLAKAIRIGKSTINRWKRGLFEPTTSNVDILYEYSKKIGRSNLEFYHRPTEYE